MESTETDIPPPETGAPAALEWSGVSDPGRHRTNNEDAFIGLVFDGRNSHFLGRRGRAQIENADFVFAVSDGMGGASLGEFASSTAVRRVAELLPLRFRMSAGGLESGFQDILNEAFTRIHGDLTTLGRSYEECSGMGATLSLCWFTPHWMYFGHVGDSRIYYLAGDGALNQVSHDHTQVGWMRRNGRITEREARLHPGRNLLQQALGAGTQFVEPQIGAVGLQPGDRFLICSDGVVEGLWDRRIGELLAGNAPVAELAGLIVDEAVENSGRDNTTAVVVDVL